MQVFNLSSVNNIVTVFSIKKIIMNIKKNIITLSSILLLTSCTSLAPFGSETAMKYLGIAKGITDATTYSITGKSTNDHIISAAFGKDCKLRRIITKKPICIEFDEKTYKYRIFNKGKVVSKNNVVDIQFPSEIYEFEKSFEKDLKKTLKSKSLNLNLFK